LGWLGAWRSAHGLSTERRQEVADLLYFEGDRRRPYLKRFATLTVLSVLIAAWGVAANSAAVVIGAMLVAPLMTPLLAFAAALVTGRPKRQGETFLIALGGAIGSVIVAFLAAAILPNAAVLLPQSGEFLSRTSPTMIDLLIGLGAGAAGAYVIVHKEAVSALPGAAIAVALVPPLAVVGGALEIGREDLAAGALLLYVTNLAAILLAAGVVFVATGVVPRRTRGGLTRQTRVGLVIAIVAVIGISFPLTAVTRTTAGEANAEATIREQAEEWIGDRDLSVVSVVVDDSDARVDVVGADTPPPVSKLEQDVDQALDREYSISVPWVQQQDRGSPLPQSLSDVPAQR
jgi:uncharacterized hydrophobic protein (TIGR00271 family)